MLVNIILSVLAGVLLAAAFPLSFAPDGSQWAWPWLAFIAPVPLFVALRNAKNALHAYLLGFLAGTILHLLGVYWLGSFGALALIALVVHQALICGFLGIALHMVLRYRNEKYNYLLVPAVWVGFEYLHSIGASSFPWLHLGYTQYDNAPVLQLAGYAGVYASSFFVLLTAYSIYHLFWGRCETLCRLKSTALACLVLLVAYGWGYYAYAAWNSAEQKMPTKTVAVVQGGLSSDVPWHLDEYRVAAFSAYVGTTGELLLSESPPPDLVVWPEGALPAFVDFSDPGLNPQIGRLWDQEPSLKLLLGLLTRSEVGLQNTGLLFIGPYSLSGSYSKNRPVAFGEFVPLGRVVRMLDYPWGSEDLREGESLDPIPFDGSFVAVNICYDSIHPSVTREQVRRGATLVAVLANNSWYNLPSGASQHRMFDFFRAVENRRAVVRAATTGISGFILPSGREADIIERNQRGWRVLPLPMNHGRSLYTVTGDLFAIVMLIIAICGVAFRTLVGVGEDML